MRYTQNINLPIVEDNDLYSKEINNLAFEKIDEEIQGLADIVEALDSPLKKAIEKIEILEKEIIFFLIIYILCDFEKITFFLNN